jgi:hypothetical protein
MGCATKRVGLKKTFIAPNQICGMPHLHKLFYKLEATDNLIQGCLQNDRIAQRQLYNFYAPVMLGVCMRYSKTREEAEEILQEGFLKVFTKIDTYKFEGRFDAKRNRKGKLAMSFLL